MARGKLSGNAGTLPSRKALKAGPRFLPIELDTKKQLSLKIETMSFPLQELDIGDIEESNQEFIETLEQLGQKVREYGVNLKQAGYQPDKELKLLREAGCAAYTQVFSDKNIRHYLQAAETKAQKKNRGLSFTFTFPQNLSPFWEMIYSGDPLAPLDPKQFWGFRYPLGRTYWQIEPCDLIELGTGIFSAIHQCLNSSWQEIETLVGLVQNTCQRQGWQLNVHFLDHQVQADSLSETELLKLFRDEEFQYGIVHFACHCLNAFPGKASKSYLYLSVHDQDLKLTLKTLQTCADNGFKNLPFVFLNACESATPGHPLQTISFPTSILRFGAGGVIATCCTIPDNFASAFASEFYRRLLEKLEHNLPVMVGEVLLETRLHFWEEYNNPLGLAYGLYAMSNQQLELMDKFTNNE